MVQGTTKDLETPKINQYYTLGLEEKIKKKVAPYFAMVF